MTENIFWNEKGLQDREFLRVSNWMTPNPHFVVSGDSIEHVAEKMDSLKVDCLPVVNANHRFIGMITLKQLFSYLLHRVKRESVVDEILLTKVDRVQPADLVTDIFSVRFEQVPVLDSSGILVGILNRRDILDGLSKYIYRLEQRQNAVGALHEILESAYEGIVVVDGNGIIQEMNGRYCRFIGLKKEEAIGRHVSEIIENTGLHVTVTTGIPERGVLQNIQGQDMVVHRIPIWKEGKVAGAIGMLIFEGVTEVYKIYESLQESHQKKKAKKELLSFQKEKDSRITLDDIIGTSTEIQNVKRITRKAARTSATVLISGESGTGKEMFAKSIHHLSPFSNGPFISVNCGAIPEHLFESELFGYEEGAFTGAKKGGKPGKFELANNGTIFLDELGEMPPLMQTKLLRVLQEKEIERVGGVKKYPINVRIIAATNRNLLQMVYEGGFREDLYYRLNIIQIHIPPLRERRKDIPILMAHYLKVLCDKYQMARKSFTSEAVSAFMEYSWRGNIRELVNTIERLVTLTDEDSIDISHLPKYIIEETNAQIEGPKGGIITEVFESDLHNDRRAGAFESNRHDDSRAEFQQPLLAAATVIEEAKQIGDQKEKELIIKALKSAGGNKSQAAKILGIHRTTLYQKVKKYGIH